MSAERSPTSVPPALQSPGRLLLGPGPSTIDPRVLESMHAPLVGHMDPFYYEVLAAIQDMLRPVFGTENPLTLAVPGTGSAAMEAALAAVIEPGDPVLVGVAGYFGSRIAEVARRLGGDVETVESPLGRAIAPEQIEGALSARPPKVAAFVHGETSTGVLQPLDEIASLLRSRGSLLLVDAVTSLGGLAVDVDEVGIDVCYSCSQKCLGCPPGFSPLTLGDRAVAVLRARKAPPASFYLDLALIERYWQEGHAYHHTAPISLTFGLYEALRIILEEGLTECFARHRHVADQLVDGLRELGLELFADPAHRLPMLTTVRVPSGVDDTAIRSRLLEQDNIEIGGGFGELKGKIWRIGLMGHSASAVNVETLLRALSPLLR